MSIFTTIKLYDWMKTLQQVSDTTRNNVCKQGKQLSGILFDLMTTLQKVSDMTGNNVWKQGKQLLTHSPDRVLI